MVIYFYKRFDKYGCFSNFAHYTFKFDNILWKTSEHFFQAHKFLDIDYFNKIKNVDSPMEAANLGRTRTIKIRDDWEEVKNDVMRKAVFEKFSQNPDIREVLLGTGDREIVEATIQDYYWGCGKDGSGKNMLGKILMETRKKLKNK